MFSKWYWWKTPCVTVWHNRLTILIFCLFEYLIIKKKLYGHQSELRWIKPIQKTNLYLLFPGVITESLRLYPLGHLERTCVKEYTFKGTKGLEAEALTCRLGRRIQIHMCGAKNEGCWERPFQRIPYLKLDFLVFLFSNSRVTPQNETFHSNPQVRCRLVPKRAV